MQVERKEYLFSRDYISLPGEGGLIPRFSWNSREKIPAMGAFSRANRTGATTTGHGFHGASRRISRYLVRNHPLNRAPSANLGLGSRSCPSTRSCAVYEYLAFSLVSSTGYGPTDGPGYYTTCATSRQVSTARFRVVHIRGKKGDING